MSRPQLVLGIDSSTRSTKVEARNLQTGEVVGRGSAPHPPTSPPISEQDPAAWFSALSEAVEQLGDLRSQVVAVAVAGQQHGLVLVDGADEVIRPAKLWNDTTSSPQADALVARLGPGAWAAGCGSLPVAAFTVTKLAWVAEHEPEALERAAKVMLPHDYLTWRLTGEHVTDRGDASGTGWFNPSSGTYAVELLAAAAPGLGLDKLPTVLGPTEAAGAIAAPVAAALGLGEGVVVGPGTGDNMGAAIGLGLGPGDVAISLGTSGTAYAVSSTGTADDTGAVAGFADATGRFLPLVCTLNATKVTDAVAGWLGTDAPGLAELALAATADPGEVSLVPYFDGERTPNLPLASGSLLGLRPTTTREQIALAAHDGVLGGLIDGVGALSAAGVATNGALLLIGGGARSVAYQQRLADLTGRAVMIPEADEAVAAGAAVQAAAVFSRGACLDIASDWHLGDGVTVEPDPTVLGGRVQP